PAPAPPVRRRPRRALVIAIALGVLALAAGALAATGVIHFGGATITRVDTLPPVYTRDSAINFLYLRDGKPHAILTVFREGRMILDKLVATSTKIRRVRVNGA